MRFFSILAEVYEQIIPPPCPWVEFPLMMLPAMSG
jgi:hypothetical protein